MKFLSEPTWMLAPLFILYVGAMMMAAAPNMVLTRVHRHQEEQHFREALEMSEAAASEDPTLVEAP